VKGINARAALISLFLGLAVVTSGYAGDYYIYRDPDGKLAISNKEPPSGSKVIRRHSWPEATDTDASQTELPISPAPNVQTESSPKPSKTK
jgi:hypothetical protein